MQFLFKAAWTVRALLYKSWFGKLRMPSYIGAPIFLMGSRQIFIDKRVRIFPGLRAECHGDGRLFIHQNISIGQGFHVTCIGDIHIREGALISGNVTVTDIDHEYERVGVPVSEQSMTWKKTDIGENCFIGIGALIQAGTILGKGCVVGANSVVRGHFPDHSVIVGAPARIVKRYDTALGKWVRC